MKTIFKFFLVLVLVSGVGAVQAQKMSFGVRGGANFAVQSPVGDYYNNDEIRTGFSGGLFTSYALNDRFSLRGELNYDQLGSATSGVVNKLDYLNIPVVISYSLGKSERTPLNFNVYGGTYAGYLLNAESTVTTSENEQDFDLMDQTNKFTGGAVAGIGMSYPFNSHKIILDLRLGIGLAPYSKDDYKPKNKYIGISLAYEF